MIIIEKPVVTEKSIAQAEHGVYTFAVHSNATKPEIAKAIEGIYKVSVVDVNVSGVHGKSVRRKTGIGKEKNWRKAFVTVKKGQKISDFEFVAEKTEKDEKKEKKSEKAK